MTKAVVTMEYKDYIMDLEDALKLAEIYSKAERFSSAGSMVHAWKDDNSGMQVLRLMLVTDDLYRKASLAGEPGKA